MVVDTMRDEIDDPHRYGKMDAKHLVCYEFLLYWAKLREKFKRVYRGD